MGLAGLSRFSRQVGKYYLYTIFFFRILSVFLSKTGSIFSNMTRIHFQIGLYSQIFFIFLLKIEKNRESQRITCAGQARTARNASEERERGGGRKEGES